MEKVQFDEPDIKLMQLSRQIQAKGLAGYLIKNNFAKTEAQANLIMLAVVVICTTITVITVVKSLSGPGTQVFNLEQIQQMQHLPGVR